MKIAFEYIIKIVDCFFN